MVYSLVDVFLPCVFCLKIFEFGDCEWMNGDGVVKFMDSLDKCSAAAQNGFFGCFRCGINVVRSSI